MGEIIIKEEKNGFKSGFIAVIGRPNVGKSTLVNSIVGEKVAAVSDKPNTTRNSIKGIYNSKNCQMIFLDTPGIEQARGKLHKSMVQASMSSIDEADLILMLIDASRPFNRGDREILESVNKPLILVINKIDKIVKHELLPVIEKAQSYGDKISDVIPVSATESDGIEQLKTIIENKLPEGVRYFPDDIYTDQPERFLAAEIIREKLFNLTKEEIPYKTAVLVEEFKENEIKRIIRIAATIFVERKSHKGIVIGKNGELLKTVGNQARLELESILGTKIFIELWVKVKEKWTENESLIREIGYLN